MQNRSLVWVIVIVLLAALLVLNAAGQLQPVHNVISFVLAPLQYSVHWVTIRFSHAVRSVRDLATLRARVEELEATVNELTQENLRLREADIERVQLREQLRFKLSNPSYDLVAAEVIGFDPSQLLQYITIDRGTEDGVNLDMPIVTAQGLVGRVTSAFPHSARVMLLLDASSSVNAIVQTSRVTGIVQGRGRQDLTLQFVHQGQQLAVGDIVLTSGLGGAFPKRLVIGQITSVRAQDVDTFQEVSVRPGVDFDRLESVLVIRSFSETE